MFNRCIPIFVCFIVTIKPRNSVHHEMHNRHYWGSYQNKEIKVNEYLIFHQSTNIYTNENK